MFLYAKNVRRCLEKQFIGLKKHADNTPQSSGVQALSPLDYESDINEITSLPIFDIPLHDEDEIPQMRQKPSPVQQEPPPVQQEPPPVQQEPPPVQQEPVQQKPPLSQQILGTEYGPDEVSLDRIVFPWIWVPERQDSSPELLPPTNFFSMVMGSNAQANPWTLMSYTRPPTRRWWTHFLSMGHSSCVSVWVTKSSPFTVVHKFDFYRERFAQWIRFRIVKHTGPCSLNATDVHGGTYSLKSSRDILNYMHVVINVLMLNIVHDCHAPTAHAFIDLMDPKRVLLFSKTSWYASQCCRPRNPRV